MVGIGGTLPSFPFDRRKIMLEFMQSFPPAVWFMQFLGAFGGWLLANSMARGVATVVDSSNRRRFIAEMFSRDASTRFATRAMPVLVVIVSIFFLSLEMMSTRGGMWMFLTMVVFRLVVWPLLLRSWRVIRSVSEKWIFFAILGALIAVTTWMVYVMLEEFGVSQPHAYAIGYAFLAALNPYTVWMVQQLAKEDG